MSEYDWRAQLAEIRAELALALSEIETVKQQRDEAVAVADQQAAKAKELTTQLAASEAARAAAVAEAGKLRAAVEYVISQQVKDMQEADSLLPIAWAARLTLCGMRAEKALNGE